MNDPVVRDATAYPGIAGEPGTAAEHLVTRLIEASPDDDCASLRHRLAGGPEVDIVEMIFLVDARHRLVGMVPTSRALPAPAPTRLAALAAPDMPTVRASADQEHVANLAIAHGLRVLEQEHGVAPPPARKPRKRKA